MIPGTPTNLSKRRRRRSPLLRRLFKKIKNLSRSENPSKSQGICSLNLQVNEDLETNAAMSARMCPKVQIDESNKLKK
jgi:hypothetical protein